MPPLGTVIPDDASRWVGRSQLHELTVPKTFVSILGRRRRGGGPSLEEACVSALMQESERAAERFANTGWAKALGDDDLQTGDAQSGQD
jgi:hypothetical protein